MLNVENVTEQSLKAPFTRGNKLIPSVMTGRR